MPETVGAKATGPRRPLRDRIALLARPRAPEPLPIQVDRRRIYILPTGFGLFLAFVLVAMLVGGLNYNNNPALILTLLVGAGLHNSFVRAHLNLSGMRLLGLHADPVHAGQTLRVRLELEADGTRMRPGLALQDGGPIAVFSLRPGERSELVLAIPTQSRGLLPPRRLKLHTGHPHGLAKAWTWLWPARSLLVYPALEDNPPPLPTGSGDAQRPRTWSSGEEPHQLRDYRVGDQLRQVAWKASAHRGNLLVREYESSTSREHLLDWHALADLGHEQRIMRLASWVVLAERNGVRYALRLPHTHFVAGSGSEHRHACLRALALMPGERG